MLPGLGGMNPAQMKRMMKQLGLKSEELKAKRVVIELEDSKLVIEEPSVTSIEMQGQKTYTIMGKERKESVIPKEDIKLVIEQTNASEEQARKALEESDGDIAEAIKKLKE